MNLRPKTKQRLLILAGLCLAVGGAGTVFVVVQLHRYENHRLKYRAAGMSAFQRGDYRTAVDCFAKYLGNDRMDSQAIYDYGIARSRLPRADMSHLIQAKESFNRYLELNPGDMAGEHQLLNVYQKLNYSAEAIDLTNKLLETNPDDVPALSAKLAQMIHEQQYQAALPVALHLNELTPDDIQTQGTTYELMWHLHKPAAELIDRADQMLKIHPQDPRFELLRAVAAYWTGDIDGSKKWLHTAATRNPPDADFILLLAGAFDHVRLWPDALDLLAQHASMPTAPPELRAALLQRLWDIGECDRALKLLRDLNANNPASDSNLIGLKMLVLFGKSQSDSAPIPDEFNTDLALLRQRQDDLNAACWASLLAAIANNNPSDIMEPVHLCQDARRSNPGNADACYYQAREYLRIGETELAMQSLRQCAQLQPDWAAPYVLMSRTMMQQGEIAEALPLAAEAVDRQPHSKDALAALALARYRRLPANAPTADIQPVLDAIHQVRGVNPDDPELLAAEVDLLARSNQAQAAADVATAAMEASADPSAATLKQLAQVDRSDHLGIAKQIAAHVSACQPTTPQQALDQVEAEMMVGDKNTASLLLPSIQAHSGPDWQTAWLQAREAMGDDSVNIAWEILADSYPGDLDVQNAVLHSPAVNTNRSLMDRSIDHLKTITGDDAIEWKLARAKWQVDGDDDAKNNANAAAASMADVVRIAPGYAPPQIIWAAALVKLGDYSGAIAHLQIAARIEPDHVGAWLDCSGIALRNREFNAAFSIATEGLKHIPGDPSLSAMKHCAQALAGLQLDQSCQELIKALAVNPRSQAGEAAVAALAASETAAEATEKLRAIADKYPGFLPVQTILKSRQSQRISTQPKTTSNTETQKHGEENTNILNHR